MDCYFGLGIGIINHDKIMVEDKIKRLVRSITILTFLVLTIRIIGPI